MLEELTATHHMSYDELGNMDSETVEKIWESYWERKSLDTLEEGRRNLVMSIYANGNVGGEDLKRTLADINARHEATRRAIILGEEDEKLDEGEFLADAPLLRK